MLANSKSDDNDVTAETTKETSASSNIYNGVSGINDNDDQPPSPPVLDKVALLQKKAEELRTAETTKETSASSNIYNGVSGINDNDDQPPSPPVLDKVALLQKKAEELRAEIQSLQRIQNETKVTRMVEKRNKTENWIDELLVNITIGEESSKIEVLNTLQEVSRVLIERRYNQDKVNRVFDRLIEEHKWDSPMLELLADACNNVDVIEREDNPNKRWNQMVERKLRHKMFAMKHGLNPD
eukprot:CAMPEP_0194195030 /NCGR_PEP_ID=MMETSP0154-20130528/75907_1 /TAXON_ID=1049557 /ORGANISM="Thalassiothrix antarctica, Strain L6-D1" /LENGTH=239 /DNA_ID=CAMNT_0038919515 /DNA_START=227 /DNA_END=943 /DNA_ORIENTATION=-